MPEEGSMGNEPIVAPKDTPLELKLRIMLRNWLYPEFREILFREAREGEDHKYSSAYRRLYAYLRALELHGAGLSYDELRKAIRGEVGFRPSRSELSYWLRGLHTPLGRMAVFDVHQPEVGLVIGLILGDGNEYQRYCYDQLYGARQELYNRDGSIIEEFRGACRRLGLAVNEKPIPPRLGEECRRLQASSTLLHLLLKRFDEFIVIAPADVQWAFIKGLWLGDGCLSNYQFSNTDLRIISTVSTLLKMHGVKHTVRGPYPPRPPGKKPRYEVYIRSCSRERFLKLAGLTNRPPRPVQ